MTEVKIKTAKERLTIYLSTFAMLWIGFGYGICGGRTNNLWFGVFLVLMNTIIPIIIAEIEYRRKVKKIDP